VVLLAGAEAEAVVVGDEEEDRRIEDDDEGGRHTWRRTVKNFSIHTVTKIRWPRQVCNWDNISWTDLVIVAPHLTLSPISAMPLLQTTATDIVARRSNHQSAVIRLLLKRYSRSRSRVRFQRARLKPIGHEKCIGLKNLGSVCLVNGLCFPKVKTLTHANTKAWIVGMP